jgi:tRNA pseudouridine55 synthase
MTYNGWLNIYKPKNITSASMVNLVKKLLPKNIKIGHCGTLDPDAEGVLPLAVGEATKLVNFLMSERKTYIFTVKFGTQTDSGDAKGTITATSDHIPTSIEVKNICSKFIGNITQIPPIFSAIKINGIRAYKLARQNQQIEMKSRNIEIFNLENIDFNDNNKSATYIVTCSKGTYVRSLAQDIALSLQTLGFVIELRRTKVGIFSEDNAIKQEELKNFPINNVQDFFIEKMLNIEAILDDILVMNVSKLQAFQIIHGQKSIFENINNIELFVVKYNGKLLAIGSIQNFCFKSHRVFNIIDKKEIIDVD